MLQINRTLVATAAVIAVGLVAVIEVAQSRTAPTAAAAIAARFPTQTEMLTEFRHPAQHKPAQGEVGKTDRGQTGEGCTREHWPYIADECLTQTEGQSQKTRRPVRTITIERRIANNASELVRTSVTELASR